MPLKAVPGGQRAKSLRNWLAEGSNSSSEWIEYDDDGVHGGRTVANVVSPDSYILFLMPLQRSDAMLKEAAAVVGDLSRPNK